MLSSWCGPSARPLPGPSVLNIDERGPRGNPDPTGTKPNIEEDKLDASITAGHNEEGGRRVEHPLLCLCHGAGRHTWIRAFASSNARDKQGSFPPRPTGAIENMGKVGGSEAAEVERAQGAQEVEAQGQHAQRRP